MISDEERERAQLQKEAEEEWKKTSPRFKQVIGGWRALGFDTSGPETRLICKVAQTAVQTSPEHKTMHVVELYWRMKDGSYFKLHYDELEGTPLHVNPEEAHRIMNTRPDYQWFLTDAQKKELQVEDFELAKARAERNPVPGPTKDGG